jgi:hypothetical protein
MYTVKISAKKLNDLRMLADWQLREMGFDPASVTAACETAKNPRHGYSTDWVPDSADASDAFLAEPGTSGYHDPDS